MKQWSGKVKGQQHLGLEERTGDGEVKAAQSRDSQRGLDGGFEFSKEKYRE